MFENYNKLTSLDLSNFISNEVIDISNIFKSCGLLVSLDISNFNIEKVIDISSLFQYCNRFQMIEFNFDTSIIKDMSSLFQNCRNLKVENVKNMAKIFEGGEFLQS